MGAQARRIGAVPAEPNVKQAVADWRDEAMLAQDLYGILHILTCGSVDDGKSTLIGRLLWDATALPDDTRRAIARSAGSDGVPDFSLLVDGLAAEREQGITIDIAWRYLDAERRRLVIIDSPGHEQYTRNMATGASQADIAIMLVDARHGLKRQTRRHAAILDLMGVGQVVLAVNKMDLVDWSEDRFRAIETEFMALARRLRFDGATAIPVSAREGANVARASDAMPWYRGRTLLGHLSQIPSRGTYTEGDFRFPVQLVLREGVDFRGLAGTVASGSARIGDEIEDSTSGRTARISRIVTMDGDRDAARAGDAVVLELDSDLDISRGSVLGRRGAMPIRSEKLSARLVWLSDVPLEPGHGTLLRTATDTVRVANFEVTTRLDLDTLTEVQHGESKTSDVLVADISVERPIALDRFADIKQTGGFLLVHALTGDTLACGVVVAAREALKPRRSRAFRVTEAMLARDICAGLEPGSKEFRRRADAVLRLLAEAGVSAEMEMEMEMESGGGI